MTEPTDLSPPPAEPSRAPRGFFLDSTRWLALFVPLAFGVGLGLGYLLWGRGTGQPEPPPAQAGQPGEIRRYDVPVDDDPSLGPQGAPITIIEFSDFNCPYCRKWHVETLPVLMAAYPDQIRYVYRDLPVVGGGAVGAEAAQAADCAGDQGAYWEFHNLLFTGGYGLSRQAYLEYARSLDLDSEALGECVDTGYHESEVQSDLAFALQLGVSSTPTFFVNGIAIVGAQPAAVFQQLIDQELGS
jgi:protein-disulfide isomerase